MHENFLRLPAVMAATAISKPTIYSLIRAGKFPKPAKVGRASVWPQADIDAWIAGRIAERDGGRDGA